MSKPASAFCLFMIIIILACMVALFSSDLKAFYDLLFIFCSLLVCFTVVGVYEIVKGIIEEEKCQS
jgi:hypothetical protein